MSIDTIFPHVCAFLAGSKSKRSDSITFSEYVYKQTHHKSFEKSFHVNEEIVQFHTNIIGALRSLHVLNYIQCFFLKYPYISITQEGEKYCTSGSPEFKLFSIIRDSPNMLDTVTAKREYGDEHEYAIAMSKGMQRRWISIDKENKKFNVCSDVEGVRDNVSVVLRYIIQHLVNPYVNIFDLTDMDTVNHLSCDKIKQEACRELQRLEHIENIEHIMDDLFKRKLLEMKYVSYIVFEKAAGFSEKLVKPQSNLTKDHLASGEWEKIDFRAHNFYSAGKSGRKGNIHYLMSIARKFKDILTSLGFEEMCTDQWIESSFWCFDTLFIPQQHPARDVQDTFFVKEPAISDISRLDQSYMQQVQKAHEVGISGSRGYRYNWSREETAKNVLRTHTTATSIQMLYKLGKKFQDEKMFERTSYFSIDRVFRNETLDATHLAEFHQVEGLVADHNLSLADLIGVFKTFYSMIGIKDLKFKPAYNPYTEPSMEIFGFHPILDKWIEVGNSGIFRPEMIDPLGLPPTVRVIAWGLSLERPTMIKYNISNIRDLFGPRAIRA